MGMEPWAAVSRTCLEDHQETSHCSSGAIYVQLEVHSSTIQRVLSVRSWIWIRSLPRNGLNGCTKRKGKDAGSASTTTTAITRSYGYATIMRRSCARSLNA